MTPENKIIQGLWIGSTLSMLELLTLRSFTRKGHEFHLYTYDPLQTPLPAGVILRDANEIIPFSQVFAYRHASAMGHGKGSYAGFSDIFRYKLLYEKGGWWVDMDITCLKPFDAETSYFFREHHHLALVGSVLKAPKGSALMLECYEEAIREVTEINIDWHKPIDILIRNVVKRGLQKYVVTGAGNLDLWHEYTSKLIRTNKSVPSHYQFIHWQNEAWNHYGISKRNFAFHSTLGKLLIDHQLLPARLNPIRRLLNKLRHSRVAYNLRALQAWV